MQLRKKDLNKPISPSEFREKLFYYVKLVKEKNKAELYLESALLGAQIVEVILLPALINSIFHKLGLHAYDYLTESRSFSNNIILYFAISQDSTLYKKLEKYRDNRNILVHKLVKIDTEENIKKFAKKVSADGLTLVIDIAERYTGKKPIPSLTAYGRGWNAALEKLLKEMDIPDAN